MPPKKDNNNPQINNNSNNSNINNELLTAVSTAPTVTITVSSTSNSNHNSSSNNNNNNNNVGSNATVITSLTPRAAAALAICSSSNNNNNNNNISAGLPDNGGQSLYVSDVAAEQRTIAYQANAKLCRLVRKCPWMYDRNHHNYAKKHILDKSWTKIAKECNDSVASCKERWRNIRAAFARSINIYKTHSGPNRVKPYYLHKELTFLVKPMMEGRDKKDDFEDDTRQDVETNGEVDVTEEEDEDEDVEHEEEEEEEFPDETAEIKSAFEALNPAITIHTEEYHQRNPTKTMQQDKIRNINNNNNINGAGGHNYEYNSLYDLPSASDAEAEFNYCNNNDRREKQMRCGGGSGIGVVSSKRLMYSAADTMDTKRLKLNSNSLDIQEADVRFLEAVLPDMALMNTRQKIIFKRKLYQTLEEVLENSANFPHNQTPSIPNEIQTSNSNNYNNNTNQTGTGNNNVSNTAAATTTTITTTGGTQVRQTVLTVNSQTARTLINNIATLNEAELQKVCGFLQTSVRPHHAVTARLTNGTQIAPSSAAAHLMHSTPKITITKVTCPPPPALRNLSSNSTATLTCNTSPIINSSGVMSSNVHSTTRGTNYNTTTTTSKEPIITNSTNNNNINNITNKNNNNNTIQNSTWNSLVPITIKDEVEDVDID